MAHCLIAKSTTALRNVHVSRMLEVFLASKLPRLSRSRTPNPALGSRIVKVARKSCRRAIRSTRQRSLEAVMVQRRGARLPDVAKSKRSAARPTGASEPAHLGQSAPSFRSGVLAARRAGKSPPARPSTSASCTPASAWAGPMLKSKTTWVNPPPSVDAVRPLKRR